MPLRLLFNVNVAWFLISHRIGIARAARDAGFDVHIAADVDSAEEVTLLESEGFHFHRMRLQRGSLSPAEDLSYLRQLYTLMRSVRPDLVHNVTIKPAIYGTAAARAATNAKIVNAISGLGYVFIGGRGKRILSRVVKAAYRMALWHHRVTVIFQNADDMGEFIEARIIRPKQAVLIRGSGVDLDAFSYSPEPPGHPLVVMPARMLRDKGVVEFSSAARMLRSNGCAANFILAGKLDRSNPSRLSDSDMDALVRETGVHWLGHVSDMPALLSNAHIVCLPSYREGMPKCLLEACAAGRAIVTTDMPGCRDVVRDGENGFLVQPRDAEALRVALSRLIEDKELRRRMGEAGRRKAETEFDVRLVINATLSLYEDLLSQ